MINEHTDVKVSEINKAAIRIWFLCYFVLGIQGFLAVDFAKFLDTFVLYPGIAALTMFAYKYYSNEPLHSPDKEEWSSLVGWAIFSAHHDFNLDGGQKNLPTLPD